MSEEVHQATARRAAAAHRWQPALAVNMSAGDGLHTNQQVKRGRLAETYVGLGRAVQLDQATADAIVAAAMPHALGTLAAPRGTRLPVTARQVRPDGARGGSLIPAWPVRRADGSVEIEYVADWGALLAGWLEGIDAPARSLAADLVSTGQRVWIGIANDVLQLFVVDPPPGTYSMVRHHALMLAAATVWLGADAVRAWQAAHAAAATAFVRRHAGADLWPALASAEAGLEDLLRAPEARRPAADVVAWLDQDALARARYQEFLQAASLGVVAVLEVLREADEPPGEWLARAVAQSHPEPEFNRAWIARWAGGAQPRLAHREVVG